MKIKYPYINDECKKCSNHYLLDSDESRCKALKIGRSDVMCAQVIECNKFNLKVGEQNG